MSARRLGVVLREAWPWLAVTAIIGAVDYVTPSTYAFASMYFIPIFPAAWRSRAVGFVVAAASTFAWIYCDLVQRPTNDIAPETWNYGTRIVVFVLAVVLASTLQRVHARIADLHPHRRGLLTLLEHEVPGPLRHLPTQLPALSRLPPSPSERLLQPPPHPP